MSEWKTAGKVRMTPKGEWDSTVPYSILDTVYNGDKTIYYIAKKAVPAGVVLTNNEYWDVIIDVDNLVENIETLESNLESNMESLESEFRETIGDLADEVEAVPNRLDSLESYVRDMSPVATVGPADMVSVDDAAPLTAEGLTVNVEPVQDKHGYGNPWPAGGGKNICEININTSTYSGLAYTPNPDASTIVVTGTADVGDSGLSGVSRKISSSIPLTGLTSIFAFGTPTGGSTGTYTFRIVFRDSNGTGLKPSGESTSQVDVPVAGKVYTVPADASYLDTYIYVANGKTVTDLTFTPMICDGTLQDTSFAPYTNICPITGWNGVTVTDESEDSQTRTASVNFGQTVYGGTVDLATGAYVIDRAFIPTGATTWEYVNGKYYCKIPAPGIKKAESASQMPTAFIMCNKLTKTKPTEIINSGGSINAISVSASSSLIIAAMAGTIDIEDYQTLEVCYELNEPVTGTLTPAQLELFKGTNHISADAGQVTVTYRQDVFLALNKRIIGLQALVLES